MNARRVRHRANLAVGIACLLCALCGTVLADGVEAVQGVALTVGDTTRARHFFEQTLGFRFERAYTLRGAAWEKLYGIDGLQLEVTRLRIGDERVDLLDFRGTPGRPIPSDVTANDRSFQHIALVVDDMAAAYATLRARQVRHASSAPQRLPPSIPAAAGIEAFYFRDPDGHFLELLHFPPDKGEARWHAASGPRVRGIDHTAIVVASTEGALAFWRDLLGLRVAGSSENFGYEQEHLNGVFGAHLLITGLRAAHGPGVELLHYLAPEGGHAAPADTRANDVWHWQVELACTSRADFDALDAALGARGYQSPSATFVDLPADALGYRRARLWRDADGHAVLLTSP